MNDIKTIHTINYRISLSYLYHPALYLQFVKMKAFSLHSLVLICSTDSERYSVSEKHFVMVLCLKVPHFFSYSAAKNPFDTDRWMLIKHIYGAGRTANHKSNPGMEKFYEIRP